MSPRSKILLSTLTVLFAIPILLKGSEKETCLNWEKVFPRVDSRLFLEVSSFHLLLVPPSSAMMQSRRSGELVAKTEGFFKIENQHLIVEFDFKSDDPDECSHNCKDQSHRSNFSVNPENAYSVCFQSCKSNAEFRYGKGNFRLPLTFKIYQDETGSIRIDGLRYRDPDPIPGKMAYIFPHYFAGDLVGCAPPGIDWEESF